MNLIGQFQHHLTENGIAPKTIESYVGDVRSFCQYLSQLGVKEETDLKRFYVVSYKNHLLESKYAVATINKKINSLQAYNLFLVERKVVQELVVTLRKNRVKVANGSEGEVDVFLVKDVVRDIIIHEHQLDQIDAELKKHMALLDYKLETMHGISPVTAAELIAEIGDISRFPNADKLANFAGIAPVQHSSGNKQKIKKSKLSNRSLYDIFYNLAIHMLGVTRGEKKPNHPMYYAYYEKKLAEGKTKWRAIICVMRKLVNVIYSMMKYKTEYKMPILPKRVA